METNTLLNFNSNLMLINRSLTETSVAETYITAPNTETDAQSLAQDLFAKLTEAMPNAQLQLTSAGCGTYIIASQLAYYSCTIQETDTEILITLITC